MTCHLVGAKPLSEPMLEYCLLDHWEQISINHPAITSMNVEFSLRLWISLSINNTGEISLNLFFKIEKIKLQQNIQFSFSKFLTISVKYFGQNITIIIS